METIGNIQETNQSFHVSYIRERKRKPAIAAQKQRFKRNLFLHKNRLETSKHLHSDQHLTSGKAEILLRINSSSEGMLSTNWNYTRRGTEYTYGKVYNCLGYQYAPLYCYYRSSTRCDIIYDIRSWLRYKGMLEIVVSRGHIWFADFHCQANRQFDHPSHLLHLYDKFHENPEFYNALMWLNIDDEVNEEEKED